MREVEEDKDNEGKAKGNENNNQSETYNQQADNDEGQQSFLDRAANFITGLLGKNDTETDNDTDTQTSAAIDPEHHIGTIVYTNSEGKNHILTAKTGEFDDNHPNEKKYFGRYIEFTENGKVVARYSPYTMILQIADDIQNAEAIKEAIIDNFKQTIAVKTKNGVKRYYNLKARNNLRSFGFLDEKGRLIKDGNEDFRHEHRARLNTNPEGITVHPINKKKATKQRTDNRTPKQRRADDKAQRKAAKRVDRLDLLSHRTKKRMSRIMILRLKIVKYCWLKLSILKIILTTTTVKEQDKQYGRDMLNRE